MFSYYTRSGVLKDEFIAYLAFSPDGRVRGKGCDAIGFFLLEGCSEVDILQSSYKFGKAYLSQSELEESSRWLLEGDEAEGHGHRLGLGLGLGQGHRAGAEGQRGIRSHVVHYGYYTAGMGAYEMDQNGAAGVAGTGAAAGAGGDFGLYGVWEPASVGSHYELQKGGVFRATPIIH